MNVEIVEQKAELTLAYKERATMDNLVAVIDKGYALIGKYLAELGKQPAGAPYAAYLNVKEGDDFAEFDLEVGFPVAEAVPAKDGLFMSKTYEGRAVATTYKGSYQTLEKAYCAAMDYIAQNSLEPTGAYYDFYLNDPDNTPEEDLLTKVVIPIK